MLGQSALKKTVHCSKNSFSLDFYTLVEQNYFFLDVSFFYQLVRTWITRLKRLSVFKACALPRKTESKIWYDRKTSERLLRASWKLPESFLRASRKASWRASSKASLGAWRDSWELPGKLVGELLPGELLGKLPGELPGDTPETFLESFAESFLKSILESP